MGVGTRSMSRGLGRKLRGFTKGATETWQTRKVLSDRSVLSQRLVKMLDRWVHSICLTASEMQSEARSDPRHYAIQGNRQAAAEGEGDPEIISMP